MIKKAFREPRFRVLLWCCFWLLCIIVAVTHMMLSGTPWSHPAAEPWIVKNNMWHHNAFSIESVRRAKGNPETARYVSLGGSVCMRSMEPKGEGVISLLRKQGIEDVDFVRLCSANASFANIAMIAAVLRDTDVDFVLFVNPFLFKQTLDAQLNAGYHYLPTYPKLRRILADHGFNRIMLFDSVRLWWTGIPGLSSLAQSLWTSTVVKREGFPQWKQGERPENVQHNRKKLRAMVAEWGEEYTQNVDLNREIVTNLLAELRDRGQELVVLDMPTNPHFDPEFAAIQPQYTSMLEELTRLGAAYYDVRSAATWMWDDFRDIHHLNSQGRQRFTPILAHILADHLGRTPSTRTSP